MVKQYHLSGDTIEMRELLIADAYGRRLDNIRIAVTAECNYRCIFCHIEGEPLDGPARPGTLSPLLRPEHYEIVAEASKLLGIKKIKLTGGEPLLRADIVEIVDSLAAHSSAEISMTTNGYFLSRYAEKLGEAGLERVNISIHSLKPEKYRFITGVPGLNKVLKGLQSAYEAGFGIKINSVILNSVNSDEIFDLAKLASKYGAVLQLIELHPVGLGARFFNKYYYPLSKIENELLKKGAKKTIRDLHNRPVYILPDGQIIEIVRPYGNPLFCSGCTRIRIGPFGDLSPCLNYKGPRPSIAEILKNPHYSREEKILKVASEIIDLVAIRRPYFMCSRTSPPNYMTSMNSNHKSLRIPHPKKKKFEEAKKALRLLLEERGSLEPRAQ